MDADYLHDFKKVQTKRIFLTISEAMFGIFLRMSFVREMSRDLEGLLDRGIVQMSVTQTVHLHFKLLKCFKNDSYFLAHS